MEGAELLFAKNGKILLLHFINGQFLPVIQINYLLIENGDWEKAYTGSYRSQVKPEALTASIIAWLARYNCQLLFCKEETSGKLIHDVLYREMKERLEALPDEPNG